jgi:methanogenic corrinoid protein MtbC1
MPTAPAFTAELLRASARALAGLASARLLETHPELLDRRADAFEAWRAHLEAQLEDLAAAVEVGDPQLFARQVRWLREAAEVRGVTAEELRLALGALAVTLRERLQENAVTQALRTLEAGVATLDEPTVAPPAVAAAARPAARAQAFLEAVLSGEARRARSTLAAALSDGELTPRSLVEEVLLPACREAGRRWHLGQLGVAEEHVVSSAVRSALVELGASAPAIPTDAPGVLLAAVSGDGHDLALHALATLLELDGWRVSLAGADTPALDLVLAAQAVRADVVALSATLLSHRSDLAETIRALRATPGFAVPILVGGGAVPDLAAARDLGADGFAPTVSAALDEARRLSGRSARH